MNALSAARESATAAAEMRLARIDLRWARRAADAGQFTDRELSMAEAELDSAREFHLEAWAAAQVAKARADLPPLIAAGFARGGWAARSARALRVAINAGDVTKFSSLTARLRRDLMA